VALQIPNQMKADTAITLLKLSVAMDKAMAAYEADEWVIFSNDSQTKKYQYDPKYFRSLSWGDNRICMHKGCNDNAIGSHTMQKSTSLLSIAEDNHLLTPRFNYRKEDYNLSLIGVNKASVFPGFCLTHEQIFGRFEDKKSIVDEQDFRLQIYRTICREIVENERLLSSSVYRNEQYTKFRDDRLNELIINEAIKLGIDPNSLHYFKHRYSDNKIRYMSDHIKRTKKYLFTLDKLKNAAFNDVSKNKAQQLFFSAVGMDWIIPCSLAGRGGIVVNQGSKKIAIDVILNVLPYEDKTYVVIASLHKYKNHVQNYLNRYINHPLNVITMVESWILYGSDHWFIKPSVWQNIDETNQKIFINEMFSNKNINAIPPNHIFNGLRAELIKKMEA
jgi:hypothetical protein